MIDPRLILPPDPERHALLRGDCRTILPSLPPAVAQAVATSPKYNVGWRYATDDGSGDRLSERDYLDHLYGMIDGCWHALRPGGVMVLNLPPDIAIKEAHGWGEQLRAWPIADYVRCYLSEQRPTWLLHSEHVWEKVDSAGRPVSHLAVRGTFNNWLTRPCHERLIVASKLGYQTTKRAWTIPEYREATKSVHRWPHGNGQHRRGDPPTFPDELVAWVLEMFTEPGDLVLDPCAGLGTVGRVAAQLGRPAWLIEIEPAYWPRLEAIVDTASQLRLDDITSA